MESRLLLYRVLALHIELASHLVAIVCEEIVIEGLHIAGNASTDTCGMGSKDSAHLRQLVVDVEQTQTSHPLISVIDDLILIT